MNSFIGYKKYISNLYTILCNVNEKELSNLLRILQSAQNNNKTIYIIGNGGNASTASHWVNDLSKGLYHRCKIKLKAHSFTDNISWITSVANDIGYQEIFSDQLKALGKKGDILISITASGNSSNIIKAIEVAKGMGVVTFSIIGFDGGKAKQLSDYCLHVSTPKGKYGFIEDFQLILNHFLCDYIAGDVDDNI